MNGSSEKHEESQLLPDLEPGVEPGGEPGVLGAPVQLKPPSQHPGQVAEGQGVQGVHGQGLVHVVHGDVIPQIPQECIGPGEGPAYLRNNYYYKRGFHT